MIRLNGLCMHYTLGASRIDILRDVDLCIAGAALAGLLPRYRLALDTGLVGWPGALVALLVSVGALGLGARYLLRQLRLAPAALLRGAS